jgi:hypothetical protein
MEVKQMRDRLFGGGALCIDQRQDHIEVVPNQLDCPSFCGV